METTAEFWNRRTAEEYQLRVKLEGKIKILEAQTDVLEKRIEELVAELKVYQDRDKAMGQGHCDAVWYKQVQDLQAEVSNLITQLEYCQKRDREPVIWGGEFGRTYA